MKTNVAYGLPSLDDEYESPLVNWLKVSRPFTKGYNGAYAEIAPYLDADQQATRIPPAILDGEGNEISPAWTAIKTVLGLSYADPALATKTWVHLYEGEGTVVVAGNGIVITSATPGRIEFTNPLVSGINIDITETDPNDNGNYIKLIAVFLAEEEALYDAGVLFRPSWVNAYRDAHTIRFMDPMQTNGSTQSEWAERPTMSMRTWNGASSYGWPTLGWPIEAMVALVNELQPEVAWYDMPHQATDEYVTEFATYVRDNQTPSIITTPEYSNEMWNWAPAFSQTAWAYAQAQALWGTDPVSGIAPNNLDWQAARATEMANIWDTVFGEEANDRVIHHLGIQTGSDWWLRYRMLNALVANTLGWPGGVALDPLDFFSSLGRRGGGIACTTYFGGNHDLVATDLPAYLATHTDEETAEWFTDKLMDPAVDESIPKIADKYVAQRTALDALGPRGEAAQMVAYEGMQHFHMVNSAYLAWYVRTVWCAYVYDQMWDVFDLHLDGPCMHLSLIGPNGLGGSWSLCDHLGDMTERYRVSLLRSRGFVWDQNNLGRIGITAL